MQILQLQGDNDWEKGSDAKMCTGISRPNMECSCSKSTQIIMSTEAPKKHRRVPSVVVINKVNLQFLHAYPIILFSFCAMTLYKFPLLRTLTGLVTLQHGLGILGSCLSAGSCFVLSWRILDWRGPSHTLSMESSPTTFFTSRKGRRSMKMTKGNTLD